LPLAHVEVMEGQGTYGASQRQAIGGGFAGYGGGQSRFDRAAPFQASNHQTPGWQRAQAASAEGRFAQRPAAPRASGPRQIDGRVIASSTGGASKFRVEDRVFHVKFGPGSVVAVDGNKLTVEFDKAGQKMVLDSFVQAA
jgi:DNA helicase-2/ATP-dependent DNA helicase PcrA